jgi:hypothetical protein
MAQDVNGSTVTAVKNIVKVNVLRANVKQTKVIDTDIVFVLDDGRTVFIRDGAVQALLDNGFSVEFSDGVQVSGQELLQSAGPAEISSVILSGPQASSDNAAIVVQAPQATGTSAAAAPSSGGGLKTWLAIGAPVVGGVVAGVLGGGGGGSSAAADTTTPVNVKPATPVINVVANDDKVNATEKNAANGVAVTGVAEASASVTVNWGSTSKTVTADSAGRWSASFSSSELPADATGTTISATVKSTAGISSDPATRTVQIDTTPPAAPVIANVAGDNIIGPIEKASQAGVDINGTAEAGSTVSVSYGGVSKSVVADAGGNWSVNYKSNEIPNPGTSPVTATARDANGNISAAAAPRSVTVAPAIDVSGQIVAGPVQSGNGLSVDIYLANGTLLVSGVRVSADGSFTATNLPIGAGDVIFARVVDSTTGADYLDEATGVAKDLNAVLLAAKAVEGTSVTMNINPLTTIAAIKAGLAADGSGTIASAAAATNANTATAQAFGLSGIDIMTTSVVVTNLGGYTSVDGLTSGEKIGAVLAALSGLDSLNAGNSQTTITSFSQSVNVDGSSGQLTSQGQVSLMRGAAAAEDKVEGSLQNLISDSLAASSLVTQVTINAIATDNIITANEAANLTLSGTVSSGVTGVTGVSVLMGTRTATATVNGSAWSYTLSAADIAALGADGAKVIQAQAALPNAASATASRLVTLKIALPAVPSLDVVSGDNAISGTEKTAGVAFAGTGEVGSTVFLTFGSVTKNALVDSAGTWAMPFLASEIPADGSSTVSVMAKDAFGNSSAALTRSIQIDTSAPGLTIIKSVTGDDLIGPSEKLAGVQIQGTAEALANIGLTFGNFVRTAKADTFGNWSFSLLSSQVPEDGETLVTVTQSDAAGNVSAVATRTVKVDAQPPAKPIIQPVATDNIINAAEKQDGVTLRGTAEPNASIELTLGTISRTIKTAANGSWSSSFTAAQIPIDGPINVTAIATDSSGNISEPATRIFTIDTVNPNLTLSVAGDNVINAAEKLANVTVTGQAEPGANVVVTLGGISRNATTNQSGVWVVNFPTVDIPADTALTSVTAQSTDQAGNISDVAKQDIRIDTVVPGTPAVPTVAGDNVINATERAGNITVNGTAEAGVAVRVTWNGVVRNVTASTLGAWSTTYTSAEQPSDGISIITARANDAAGNANAVDGTRSITTLTALPLLPVINQVAGDDRINIVERAAGVTVNGTATANAKVAVTFGTTSHVVDANGSGAWTDNFTAGQVTAEGAVRPITAVQTDVNGNVSGTATRNVEVDLTAPVNFVVNQTGGVDGIVNATEKAAGVAVSGTATDAANIEVIWGIVTKTVAVTSGVWTAVFAASEVPADIATSTIRATAMDTAGNPSVEKPSNVTIDTVVPGATVISTVAGNDVINATERAGNIAVSGTAENNARLVITWNGIALPTMASDIGAWSVSFNSAQQPSDGISIITARATDAAGNANAVDGTRSITTLTALPLPPIIDEVAGDDRINIVERAAGVTVNGTATANAKVAVTFGTTTRVVDANGSGAWTANFTTGQVATEGAVRPITAVQTDVNGNVSGTATRNVEVDLTEPAVPGITTPIAGDNFINAVEKNAGVTISGTAPNSTVVEVRIGGGTPKSLTSSGTGLWSVTFASGDIPADATGVLIEARTIDAAGNRSNWVGSPPVIIDTVALDAPTGLDLAAADDSGSDDADNVTSQTSALTISGRAEANARVELFNGTTSLGTTNASGIGAFSLDVTLAPGVRSITAKTIDAAGNVSAASAALTITVDTTAPAAPTSLDLIVADDSGDSPTDNLTNKQSVTITGTAEVGSTVELFDGTTSLGTTTANASGAFSLDVTLAAGARLITAKAIDTAGTVSAASAALTITVDATAPNTPTGLDLAAADDTGSSNSDNVTSQASGLTITGQAEANARVELFDGTTSLGTTTANASGAFSRDVTLAAGARSITAKAIDAAGNVSAASAALTITVDATAPAAPTGLDLITADDTGDSPTDNLTNKQSVTITGTAEVGSTVELFDGTTSRGTTTASANGAFSFTVTLAAGAHAITSKATDAAGNVSLASAALAITVDTTAPAAPRGFDLDAIPNLSAIVSGTGGFVINGASAGDNSGRSVSSAGDVNNDGYDDLIVGALNADPFGNSSGASYVVFGKAGGTQVNLSAIAIGTGGFVINGVAAGDNSGFSVSSAGDVNGDGFDDLIVGAPYADPFGNNSGASYVVFGKANGTPVNLSAIGTGGFAINAAAGGVLLGISVSSAGDVNGDGIDDLIVGAPYAAGRSGASYVVFGKKGNTDPVNLSAIASGTGGFVINGASGGDRSGVSVSSAGDVNNDGYDDLIVGADGATRNGNQNAGASYVVFGKTNGTPVNLSAIASGTGGFVINGALANDRSCRSVRSAGDVNKDGFDDLIVGAEGADPNGSSSGASYVVFGKTNGTPVNLSAIGTGGFVINGVSADDRSGVSVSSAGDVNRDGYDDLIVGADGADPNGRSNSGASYVVFGKANNATQVNLSAIVSGTGGFVINGASAGDNLGRSVSSAGDVNNDGYDDLIVGALNADPNGSDSGASYVVFGGGDFSGAGSTFLDLAAADDTGSSSSDNITSQTSGLTIRGKAEANVRVELFDGTTSLGTTTANASGAFSLDVTLAAGARSITAKAIDVAGNVSAGSAALAVTVDTTAPLAPVINVVSGDNKVNATEAASGITISGTAEANATVKLNWGSTTERTLTADSNGNWSTIYSNAELPTGGTSTITATQTDTAGNTSGQALRSVEIDLTPVIMGMSIDYGTLGDFTTDGNTAVLTGTGFANGTIEQLINGETGGTATVDSAGLWVQNGVVVETGVSMSLNNFAPAIPWTDQSDQADLVSPPESSFASVVSWTDQAVLGV